VDQKPELVGGSAAAGRTIRGKMQFVCLDQILGLPTGAIDLVVEPARRAGEIGDDKAAVGAF